MFGIDGVYGNDTIRAVRNFQEANGLKPTGDVDLETKNKLGIESSLATVTALQKWLKKLGFYPGEINGIKDRDTDIAIEKAKSEYGVEIDEPLPVQKLR